MYSYNAVLRRLDQLNRPPPGRQARKTSPPPSSRFSSTSSTKKQLNNATVAASTSSTSEDPWVSVPDPSDEASGRVYWWNTETDETTELDAPRPVWVSHSGNVSTSSRPISSNSSSSAISWHHNVNPSSEMSTTGVQIGMDIFDILGVKPPGDLQLSAYSSIESSSSSNSSRSKSFIDIGISCGKLDRKGTFSCSQCKTVINDAEVRFCLKCGTQLQHKQLAVANRTRCTNLGGKNESKSQLQTPVQTQYPVGQGSFPNRSQSQSQGLGLDKRITQKDPQLSPYKGSASATLSSTLPNQRKSALSSENAYFNNNSSSGRSSRKNTCTTINDAGVGGVRAASCFNMNPSSDANDSICSSISNAPYTTSISSIISNPSTISNPSPNPSHMPPWNLTRHVIPSDFKKELRVGKTAVGDDSVLEYNEKDFFIEKQKYGLGCSELSLPAETKTKIDEYFGAPYIQDLRMAQFKADLLELKHSDEIDNAYFESDNFKSVTIGETQFPNSQVALKTTFPAFPLYSPAAPPSSSNNSTLTNYVTGQKQPWETVKTNEPDPPNLSAYLPPDPKSLAHPPLKVVDPVMSTKVTLIEPLDTSINSVKIKKGRRKGADAEPYGYLSEVEPITVYYNMILERDKWFNFTDAKYDKPLRVDPKYEREDVYRNMSFEDSLYPPHPNRANPPKKISFPPSLEDQLGPNLSMKFMPSLSYNPSESTSMAETSASRSHSASQCRVEISTAARAPPEQLVRMECMNPGDELKDNEVNNSSSNNNDNNNYRNNNNNALTKNDYYNDSSAIPISDGSSNMIGSWYWRSSIDYSSAKHNEFMDKTLQESQLLEHRISTLQKLDYIPSKPGSANTQAMRDLDAAVRGSSSISNTSGTSAAAGASEVDTLDAEPPSPADKYGVGILWNRSNKASINYDNENGNSNDEDDVDYDVKEEEGVRNRPHVSTTRSTSSIVIPAGNGKSAIKGRRERRGSQMGVNDDDSDDSDKEAEGYGKLIDNDNDDDEEEEEEEEKANNVAVGGSNLLKALTDRYLTTDDMSKVDYRIPHYSVISRLYRKSMKELQASIVNGEIVFKKNYFEWKIRPLLVFSEKAKVISQAIAAAVVCDKEVKRLYERFVQYCDYTRSNKAQVVGEFLNVIGNEHANFKKRYDDVSAAFHAKQARNHVEGSEVKSNMHTDKHMGSILVEAQEKMQLMSKHLKELELEEELVVAKLRSEELTAIRIVTKYRPLHANKVQSAQLAFFRLKQLSQQTAARIIQKNAKKKIIWYYRNSKKMRAKRRLAGKAELVPLPRGKP